MQQQRENPAVLSVMGPYSKIKVKGKAIPVTGHRGPQGCDISRLSHILYNQLTNCGQVVSLTHRTPFNPKKIPGTHF
jgi:hypothetical protein